MDNIHATQGGAGLHRIVSRPNGGTGNENNITHGGPEAARHGVQSPRGTLQAWLRNRFHQNTSGSANPGTFSHATQNGAVPITQHSLRLAGGRAASWNDLPTEMQSKIFEASIDGVDTRIAVRRLARFQYIDKGAQSAASEILNCNRHFAIAQDREEVMWKKDLAVLAEHSKNIRMDGVMYAEKFKELVNKYHHIHIFLGEFPSLKRRVVLDVLSASTHLQSLRLGAGSSVNTQAVIDAAKAIGKNNPGLREFHLDMVSKALTPEQAQALADNSSLTSLNASWARHDIEVLQALANSRSLKALNVSHNEIGDAGAQALATSLGTTGQTSIDLDVSDNDITDAGIQSLAGNRSITSLCVNDNHFGPAGAGALGDNHNLIALKASCCRLGDESALLLARNPSFTSLELGSNKLTDTGVLALLAHIPGLSRLDVSRNFTVTNECARAMANSTSLKFLDVSFLYFRDAGIATLAESKSIIELRATNNKIGNAGAKKLAGSSSITVLHAQENRIGYFGARALFKNFRFISLDLSRNDPGSILAKRSLSSRYFQSRNVQV